MVGPANRSMTLPSLPPSRRALLLALSFLLCISGAVLLALPQPAAPTPLTGTPPPSARTLTNRLLVQLALPASTSSRRSRLQATAQERADQLTALMASNPAEASRIILPSPLLSLLRPEVSAADLEQSISLSGTLEVLTHDPLPPTADNLKNHQEHLAAAYDSLTPSGANNHRQYFLTDTFSGHRYALYLNGTVPRLETGDLIQVQGMVVRDSVLVDTKQITVLTPAPATANGRALPLVAPGNRTILAILTNFSNVTSQPFTPAQVNTALFGASNSVNSYYNNVSFGATTFSGTVTNWLTLSDTVGTTCNETTWSIEAQNAATAAGYTPANYTHVMIVMPALAPCNWAGTAQVSGRITWIYGYLATAITGHEIGHNLGMDHAGSYSCGSRAIDVQANCSFSEYGNNYDVMGGNYPSAFALDAPHAVGLGYFPPSFVQNATSNGTYTLLSLESATAGIHTVKIHKPDTGQDYYLEYRQPIGQDVGLPSGITRGVGINLWTQSPYYTQRGLSSYSATGYTYQLDTSPGSGGGFTDAALADGSTFTDSANNITVTQVSHNTSSATVQVTFGGATCSPVAPTITINPTTQTAPPGTSVLYGITLIDNDNTQNCSSRTFSLSATAPSGWTASFRSSSMTLAPGATGYGLLSVTSSAGASNAVYTVTVSSDGATAPLSYVVYAAATQPPPPPTPTPTPTPPPPPVVIESTPTPLPPGATPRPTLATPNPTPTPKPKTPTKATPTPTPKPTPTPTPTPVPTPTPTPPPTPTPTPAPTPSASPTPSSKPSFSITTITPASPTAKPVTTPAPAQRDGLLLTILGGLGLLAAVLFR